jgi:signal transduction histidine kinase
MTPDGLPPDAAARDSRRPGRRTWRRDVIEGVTRRFAFAAVPALVLGLVARTVRREWDLVALLAVTLLGVAVALSPRLPPRARVALIVGLLVWANGVLMVYARDIPFHGLLIPTTASFAAVMGGSRWGWWVLAVTSATWLVPWAMPAAGLQPLMDIVWPSQYLRIWFFHTSLTAGLLATIGHVTRHLEAAMEHGDTLLDRVRTEARAVQALAGRVREAEEGERKRLARELHDDFGQRLTALRMKLQLSRLRPDEGTAAIDDCVAISEELLQDVRAFARGLRPPLLDEVGLGPALQALIDGNVDRSACIVTLDVPERLPRLPPSIELAAYRVVQEALANLLRHSGASRLSLAARNDGGELAVWLIDDGCGFDPEQAAGAGPGQHLGLVSMRERAAFAGGSLEIDSAPGRGTTVCLRIPLATAARTSSGPEPAVAS